MSNDEILSLMRMRRQRIEQSIGVQTHAPTKQLLSDELVYCNAQIEYREKYGDGSKFYVPLPDSPDDLPRV